MPTIGPPGSTPDSPKLGLIITDSRMYIYHRSLVSEWYARWQRASFIFKKVMPFSPISKFKLGRIV